MFTGLVKDVGTIERITPSGTGLIFRIKTALAAEGLEDGESIAVNGVCLTVTDFDAVRFDCELSKETLDRSNLGGVKAGDPVNLERAMRLGDRLGGHLMQGHVDGRAKFLSDTPDGTSHRLAFEVPSELRKYIIEKGSIALDGISLTVNKVEGNRIEVNIIPATWEKTTLGKRAVGAIINVEVDMLGKYVESILGGHLQAAGVDAGSISKAFLAEQGFLGE